MSSLLEQVPRREDFRGTGDGATAIGGWRASVPFLIGAAVYAATTFAILYVGWRLAEKHFIYALDDVYINMAVAKHFALEGVWGVTPFEFSSCTSSPLYVLLLSGVYGVFGPGTYAPLVISWGFGLGATYVAAEMLKERLSVLWQTTALLAFVLLTPLFVLGTLGMEHSLHLLLTLLFLRCFQDDAKPLWLIGVVTAVMVGVRFEGLLLARRWARAGVVAVTAWVPVAVYAAFSIAHGGSWLPNSVLLKGVNVHGLGMGDRLQSVWNVTEGNLQHAPHLPFLLAGVLGMAIRLRRTQATVASALAVVGVAGVLHLMTADVGWAFRYESYLLGAGVVAMATAWPLLWGPGTKALTALVYLATVCGGILLIFRCIVAATLLPQFSQAIYRQQWQTARFLEASYAGASIAANDIGVINYVSDLHCLDLAGLASGEVFRAKREGEYTTEFLEQAALARGVRVAVLYDTWFSEHPITLLGGPPVPRTWIRVRRWSVPERMQLGDRTVSFYALDAEQAALLKARLDAFEHDLPKGVAEAP
jgi:hypothetical protein